MRGSSWYSTQTTFSQIFTCDKFWNQRISFYNPFQRICRHPYKSHFIFFRERWPDFCQVLPFSQVLRLDPHLGQAGCVRHRAAGQKGFLCPRLQRGESSTTLGLKKPEVRGNAHHHRLHPDTANVLQVTDSRNGGVGRTQACNVEK